MSGETYKLSDQPEEVIEGLRAWRNPGNAFTAVTLHFTADPDGADEEARRAGLSEEAYKREHGLDFTSFAGQPVYRHFDESRHVPYVSRTVPEVHYSPDYPVWRGWDFGYHHPAVVYAQVHGGFWIVGELMGEDMTLEDFYHNVVSPYEDIVFKKAKFIDVADPAGRQVSDKSQHSSFAILSNYGIHPMWKKTEINEGLTIIRTKLTDGTMKFHPRCRILIEGMKGGYRYPEPTKGKPEPLFPLKDGYYEHTMDALRYIAVHAYTLYVPPPEKKPETHPPFVERVLARQKKQGWDPDFGAFD